MSQSLKLHAASICGAVTQVEIIAERLSPGGLALRYVVAGKISGLRIPPSAAPARADELWRHTCFEAFIRDPSSDAYYEFNFAPSTQWAAYHFDGYRNGMAVAGEAEAPIIDVQSTDDICVLEAKLELAHLPDLPADAPWALGLSAVIEDNRGNKSYWALAHPPGKPDFHHADCFALQISPDSLP